MASMIGEENKPVQQPEDVAENNMAHPSWVTWPEDEETGGDVGIGDSVYVDRNMDWSGEGRATMLREGESIVPGVPLPDMSGENWSG